MPKDKDVQQAKQESKAAKKESQQNKGKQDCSSKTGFAKAACVASNLTKKK